MVNQKAVASASLQDTKKYLKKRFWQFDYCVRELQQLVSSNLEKDAMPL